MLPVVVCLCDPGPQPGWSQVVYLCYVIGSLLRCVLPSALAVRRVVCLFVCGESFSD